MSPEFDREGFEQEAGDLLGLSTMTLATTSREAAPHAAPVYFAAVWAPRLRLYFFSEANSRHARDLLENPLAAAAIYPECRGWQDIRGLQLMGSAEPVPHGDVWEAAWEAYQEKFPFVAGLKPIVEQNELYAFTPTWIRLVDNPRGFGFKLEWEIP